MMILLPHEIDLPPPDTLQPLFQLFQKCQLFILVPSNSSNYFWLLDLPENTIDKWIRWRSTVYRIVYRYPYTIDTVLIRQSDCKQSKANILLYSHTTQNFEKIS